MGLCWASTRLGSLFFIPINRLRIRHTRNFKNEECINFTEIWSFASLPRCSSVQMQNEGSNGGHSCEQDLEKQGKSQEGLSVVGSDDEANQTLPTIVISNGETPEPNRTDNNNSKDELPPVMSPKKGYLSRSFTMQRNGCKCTTSRTQPSVDAAMMIQHNFREYVTRRSQSVRSPCELAVAKAKLREIKALCNNYPYRHRIACDAEERWENHRPPH
ncbi:hypothetical protein Dsin_004596 [Dipteronia sinensis]|uniref:Uncharacterized protein n=1 Tax=Dipteronia sinensis TaxID=43782 RepID=A0AAE0AWC5_9ROSI|nr:hypothetical protein Dsin_004596 [Dipteronia sinensis]